MENHFVHAATVFMGFFAVMNPISTVPIFLGVTADADAATKKVIARKSLSMAFIIILVFCVAGRALFDVFGITLPAVRISGGAIVFLMGVRMLGGEHSPGHTPSGHDPQQSRQAQLSVAVSPLAVPVLAGPGTIATAVNFVSHGDRGHVAITVSAFFVLCLITYALFVGGERVVRYLGASALDGITRLMGLILAAIGTQLIIDGIRGVISGAG